MDIGGAPGSATWLQTERRTDLVRLDANPRYWDRRRGPRVASVQFRNDLTVPHALDLVCDTDGEVDIVTEVPPAAAERVQRSEHATLVAVDAFRVLAGVLDRTSRTLQLHDVRARQALNLAVDRNALVHKAMHGFARPLAGLTPSVPLTRGVLAPDRLTAFPHDPERAARLWRAVAGPDRRTLRLACWAAWTDVAEQLAEQLTAAVGLQVDIDVLDEAAERAARRRLASKDEPQEWDVLVLDHGAQSADAPPLELHRAFVGRTGEFRSGPVDARFEQLYGRLVRQTGPLRQMVAVNRIDRYVTEQALALFLVAPQALYAVNREVRFRPYRTTFELADTEVTGQHWSR